MIGAPNDVLDFEMTKKFDKKIWHTEKRFSHFFMVKHVTSSRKGKTYKIVLRFYKTVITAHL